MPYLHVFGELFVEFLVLVGIVGELLKQLHTFLHQVLTNDLEDFTLLKHFSRYVEWQVFAVHNTLHKVQVLGNQLLTIVHNEDAAHVQLYVVLLFLILEHVERSALWYVEQRPKL